MVALHAPDAPQNGHYNHGGSPASSKKRGQQAQGQNKPKKQKLVELDDTPPKPWKPLDAADVVDGQRCFTQHAPTQSCVY